MSKKDTKLLDAISSALEDTESSPRLISFPIEIYTGKFTKVEEKLDR